MIRKIICVIASVYISSTAFANEVVCYGSSYNYYFRIESNKCTHYQVVIEDIPDVALYEPGRKRFLYKKGKVIDGFILKEEECKKSIIDLTKSIKCEVI